MKFSKRSIQKVFGFQNINCGRSLSTASFRTCLVFGDTKKDTLYVIIEAAILDVIAAKPVREIVVLCHKKHRCKRLTIRSHEF